MCTRGLSTCTGSRDKRATGRVPPNCLACLAYSLSLLLRRICISYHKLKVITGPLPRPFCCFLAMSCNIHMNELPLIDAAYPHRTRREHTSLACLSLTMQHKLALNIEAELEDDTDRGYLFVLHIVQFISRTKYISITNCQLNLHCSWINPRRKLQNA